MMAFIPVILSVFYLIMIYFSWRKERLYHAKLRSVQEDSNNMVSAALAMKRNIIKSTPHQGPLPVELENSEALRLAWEEYKIIYNLVTQK